MSIGSDRPRSEIRTRSGRGEQRWRPPKGATLASEGSEQVRRIMQPRGSRARDRRQTADVVALADRDRDDALLSHPRERRLDRLTTSRAPAAGPIPAVAPPRSAMTSARPLWSCFRPGPPADRARPAPARGGVAKQIALDQDLGDRPCLRRLQPGGAEQAVREAGQGQRRVGSGGRSSVMDWHLPLGVVLFRAAGLSSGSA